MLDKRAEVSTAEHALQIVEQAVSHVVHRVMDSRRRSYILGFGPVFKARVVHVDQTFRVNSSNIVSIFLGKFFI